VNDINDNAPSLYQTLGARVSPAPGFGKGETVLTEQVETVDGDRAIEPLLAAFLIG
jgi:hypothetical protein